MGNKWFAGWGVLKFDGTNWTTYFTSNGLVNNTVHAIAIDVSGNKWFGTDSGVSELSGSTWTNYTVNSTSNGLSNNQVYCIAIDASGNKWFGTNGGVSKFDGSNWTKFTTSNGLVNNYVYAIAIDISGNKWFGTNGGVSKFDGTNWTTYTAPGGVVSIAIDAQGNKWFGTWSGVSKFDGLNWITYSTSNGLSDNNIRSIAIDAKGNKWIGTYPAGAIKMSCVAPVASFVPINTCINQNVLLKNNSSKTDTSTIYQWDLDNNTSIDSTKRNISYLATTSNRAVRLRAYNESCYDDTIITITPLTVPTIQTRTPRMRCNAGTITLEATASAGTVNWYNAFSGGNSINTGNTYPTPQLSASKAYYLDATSNGCTTSYRVEITATVNMPPSINSVTSGSCCNSGKVELAAKPSVGSVIWYSADGTVLANNSGRYTTPLISATTTYYVAASNNECISASRTSVTASVIQLSTTQQYNIWGPTVVCGGDKPTFSITIPNATSYTWTLPAGISGTPTSNTINAVFPDNVSWGNTSSIKVMGINGTCTSQVMSLPITFYPVKTPVIKVKWGALLVCKNADNDIKNFQWYDNYQAISGATAQYYNSIGKSGSYYVICTYNNSCSFPSAHVSVNGVKKVSITPNPVNTLATVTLSFMETGSTELCIYNSNGQKIKLFSFDKTDTVQETTINFSDLPSGSYLLKGKTGDEITEGVVFIKK